MMTHDPDGFSKVEEQENQDTQRRVCGRYRSENCRWPGDFKKVAGGAAVSDKLSEIEVLKVRKEKEMECRVFAGLTEEEWAAMEFEERYDPDGGYRGLVLTVPQRFVQERLLHLGNAAVVVGTAIWSLAFDHKGQPLSCRDIRLLACRLGTWEPIGYDAALAVLESAGLVGRAQDDVVPLFYEDEKATLETWRQEKDPGRRRDYIVVPSFAAPDITAFLALVDGSEPQP